jgi:DNA-binding MarR family transcriptional regulator
MIRSMSHPNTNATTVITAEISRDCLLTRARRISRVITGIYDQELRPYGINSPQFSLLVLISRLNGATRAEIGRANNQERSTLSRNLALLLEEGWVKEVAGIGRSRPILISPAGKAQLEQAVPAWRIAQEKAAEILGDAGRASILGVGTKLENHQFA